MTDQTIYAIGDVQGCFDDLQALLKLIDFNSARDRLWFVGDLVNRGPKSLEVLRFIYGLGERAVTVLGNHDLHLLAVAAGAQPLQASDTLSEILAAPDRETLLNWLRHCPLMHHDSAAGYTLVHAGIPPQWSLSDALSYAKEVEQALQDPSSGFLEQLYGNEPSEWSESLNGWDRLRYITNALTRMRFCSATGKLNLTLKETAVTTDPQLLRWFEIEKRNTSGENIIFGHWAALRGKVNTPHVFALDTGCVWGGALTAMRLRDQKIFSHSVYL
jgi:bis(5'-nucleosyl)-tetraphosphatase (symmetrical)